MFKLSIGEAFGGMGAFTASAKRMYGASNVQVKYYIEINKHAVKTYNALNGTNYVPTDINDINASELPKVDILVAGFPCQDFSRAGKDQGLKGKNSSLIYLTIEKVREMKNKPSYILLENVKDMLKEKHKEDMAGVRRQFEELGYHWDQVLLNSLDFGIPQSRERVFILLTHEDIATLPDLQSLTKVKMKPAKLEKYLDFTLRHNVIDLKKLKETDYGEKVKWEYSNYYYLPPKDPKKPLNDLGGRRIWKAEKFVGTIPASYPPKIGYINWNKQLLYRKLDALECFHLMGFTTPDFKKCIEAGVSEPQLKKQAGNSIVVNILDAINEVIWGKNPKGGTYD